MFTSRHHPNGGAVHHFDNEQVTECIRRYQALGDPEALAGFVAASQERAKILIRHNAASRYVPENELISDVTWKLLRAVPRFNPERGSAFCFVSCVTMNVLHSAVNAQRKRTDRYTELDESIVGKLSTNGNTHRETAEDLAHRIKSGVRTTLSDPHELDACRWYVDSFLAGAFELRRHECADACMVVHQLSHSRCRELHDLMLLECRRALYPELPPRQTIIPGRLIGTRSAWMTQYAALMNAVEFTKFATLVKALGPFVLLLVDPLNCSRRQDRCPAVSRRNIEFVLNGCPNAVPLF